MVADGKDSRYKTHQQGGVCKITLRHLASGVYETAQQVVPNSLLELLPPYSFRPNPRSYQYKVRQVQRVRLRKGCYQSRNRYMANLRSFRGIVRRNQSEVKPHGNTYAQKCKLGVAKLQLQSLLTKRRKFLLKVVKHCPLP